MIKEGTGNSNILLLVVSRLNPFLEQRRLAEEEQRIIMESKITNQPVIACK